MHRFRIRIVLGVSLAFVAAGLPALGQQQPTTLAPEAPRDGASVGKKPRFVIRASGANVEKLKFRIELSTDEFRTVAYTFDQLKDANGWAYTALDDQSPGAVYFTRNPIAGGDYTWRVASWDGLSWKEALDRSRLQVDDVPPADVDGVLMDREARKGCIRIRWQSVVTDVNGGSERVGLYHVYRYTTKGPTHPIRLFEAGQTPDLEFEDCDKAALKSPLLFYRVVAEDEAGNIPGRKF